MSVRATHKRAAATGQYQTLGNKKNAQMPVQNNFEDTSATNELALVSRALKDQTRCDKLNVAMIGNVAPQLHIHIVARTRDDPLWPKPVWGAAPLRPTMPQRSSASSPQSTSRCRLRREESP